MIPPHPVYRIYLSFLDCTPPKCGKLSEYTDSAHTKVEDLSSKYTFEWRHKHKPEDKDRYLWIKTQTRRQISLPLCEDTNQKAKSFTFEWRHKPEGKYPYLCVKSQTRRQRYLPLNEGRKEMFYLTMHSTHFIYGYMASDIWLRTILIVRKETCSCHIGYSFWLTARVPLYAPFHRQDNTYHSLCYTSRGALAGMGNSSMGSPHEESIRRPIAPWANTLTTELHLAPHLWMKTQTRRQRSFYLWLKTQTRRQRSLPLTEDTNQKANIFTFEWRHKPEGKDLYLWMKTQTRRQRSLPLNEDTNQKAKIFTFDWRHKPEGKYLYLWMKTQTRRQRSLPLNEDTNQKAKIFTFEWRHKPEGKDLYLWMKTQTRRQRSLPLTEDTNQKAKILP